MMQPVDGDLSEVDYSPEDELKFKIICAWKMIGMGLETQKVLDFCRLTQEQLDENSK